MYKMAKAVGESPLVIEIDHGALGGNGGRGSFDTWATRRNGLQQSTQSDSLAVRLQRSRLQLHTIAAEYAMYLPDGQQEKIAQELRYVLDAESWEPDDAVPSPVCFRSFMMWSVVSDKHTWDSLGFDADGSTMVAWVEDGGTFTAKFRNDNFVQWSLNIDKGGDLSETSVGVTSLKLFVLNADEYLEKIG